MTESARQEVLVLDFGGQYSQLIARRVRECGVFSELLPHTVPLDEIRRRGPRGLILSGGAATGYGERGTRLRCGAPSAYTDAGPPERISPRGPRRRISS